MGIMAVLLLLSLGFGLYVMFVPGDIEPVKPLFGTLPVLRGGLLVLLGLLSAYILRGEVEHSKLLRELWEKKINIDTLNQRVMDYLAMMAEGRLNEAESMAALLVAHKSELDPILEAMVSEDLSGSKLPVLPRPVLLGFLKQLRMQLSK